MKHALLFVIYFAIATGCSINPSKEARIQQLESEMQQALKKELENKYQAVDSINFQLKTRIIKLERNKVTKPC